MSRIEELAESLGRALGGTPEHRALTRARRAAEQDPEVSRLSAELDDCEREMQEALRSGEKPDPELLGRYQTAVSGIEALTAYQGLVAAQANFEKVMHRADAAIQKGMQTGGSSPLILLS